MKATQQAGRRERRVVGAEFKAGLVRFVVERRATGVTLAQVERELNSRPDQLRVWTRQEHVVEQSGVAVSFARESR